MHACMCVCVRVHVCVSVHACTRVCVCASACADMYFHPIYIYMIKNSSIFKKKCMTKTFKSLFFKKINLTKPRKGGKSCGHCSHIINPQEKEWHNINFNSILLLLPWCSHSSQQFGLLHAVVTMMKVKAIENGTKLLTLKLTISMSGLKEIDP